MAQTTFLPAPFAYLKYRVTVSKQKHVMCPGDILSPTSRSRSRKCCAVRQQRPDSFLWKENMTLFQIPEEASTAPGTPDLPLHRTVAGRLHDFRGFATWLGMEGLHAKCCRQRGIVAFVAEGSDSRKNVLR